MTSSRSDVGLRSERGAVLGALMLVIALVALDSTIVATVVPSIVADLGGFTQFPWLFSAYVLTSAVTTPIYGRLADVFGRRPVLFVGIALFVLGSALCTAAWSMPTLIVARAVQGLGAGSLMPVAMTVIGDLYSVGERARMQGYISVVWASSSVIGPAVGGLVVTVTSWRWLFAVNLPLGVLAAVRLYRSLPHTRPDHGARADWLGSSLLALGVGTLVFALLQGGVAWAWTSVTSWGLLAVSVALLAAFVITQSRSDDPVLPLWMFRGRLAAVSALQIGVGIAIAVMATYVPTFVQGVLGGTALAAGAASAAGTLGWTLAAAGSGWIYLRYSFKVTTVIGGSLALLAALTTLAWGPSTSVLFVSLSVAAVGVGTGLVAVPTLVGVQGSVPWQRRGAATATILFLRSLGTAIGAALFGAVANAALVDYFRSAPPAIAAQLPQGSASKSLDLTQSVLGTGPQPGVSAALHEFLRLGLEHAIHAVLIALVVISVGQFVLTLVMPRSFATDEADV